jgi:hypothetical protein
MIQTCNKFFIFYTTVLLNFKNSCEHNTNLAIDINGSSYGIHSTKCVEYDGI